MGTKKGLLKGQKIGGRHTTIIEQAVGVIEALKKFKEVKKIIPGLIAPCKSSQPRIRCREDRNVLILKVYGNRAVQLVSVVSIDHEETKRKLDLWQNGYASHF